jgi:hypothetical protein
MFGIVAGAFLCHMENNWFQNGIIAPRRKKCRNGTIRNAYGTGFQTRVPSPAYLP